MSSSRWMLVAFACLASADLYSQNSQPVAAAEHGKLVYEQNCLACHQSDGSGVPNLAPPLIKGTFVTGEKKRLIRLVLEGLQGVEIKGEFYANPMPAFDYLTDADIADVLTYIRSNFENKEESVTEAEVKEARMTK